MSSIPRRASAAACALFAAASVAGCTADSAPPPLNTEASCTALKEATSKGGGGGDPAADVATLDSLRSVAVDRSVEPVKQDLVQAYERLVEARASQAPGATELGNYGELDAAIAAASRRLSETCS